MGKSIQQLFLDAIQKNLAFLVKGYGFSGPYSNFGPEDELYLYSVWFMGKNLGIEFNLDWRDQSVDCYIVRLINGKMPAGWFVNEQGLRIRYDLAAWIREIGIKEHLFTNVKGLKFEDSIPIQIKDYARIIKKFGKAVLEDRADVFPTER